MSMTANPERKRAAYPAHRPSGVPWLGDVPKHWEVKRLKYLADIRSGEDEKAEDGEHPLYGANGPIGCTDTASFTSPRVLIGRVGSSGAINYVRGAFGVSDNCLVLDRPRHVHTDYLHYASLVLDFTPEISKNAQPLVTATNVGTKSIAYPPLAEQRAIAAFLDRETARIDALIERKRRQIELLQEKRSALISHAVTSGLDPHAPLKDSGIEWLGQIPAHWDVKRIKHLGSIRYGLGEPPEYVDEGLPFIRATDIKRGKIDMDSVRKVRREDVPWSRRPTLQLGEILVVRSGAYTGDTAIVTENVAGCIAGYDMVLTVTKAHSPFVAWALLSRYMLEGQIYLERMRAAQPHLNAEELGGFVILMPPIEEQRQITNALHIETGKLDVMADRIRDSIDVLREHRSALIAGAVTGKIDVREEV